MCSLIESANKVYIIYYVDNALFDDVNFLDVYSVRISNRDLWFKMWFCRQQ